MLFLPVASSSRSLYSDVVVFLDCERGFSAKILLDAFVVYEDVFTDLARATTEQAIRGKHPPFTQNTNLHLLKKLEFTDYTMSSTMPSPTLF